MFRTTFEFALFLCFWVSFPEVKSQTSTAPVRFPSQQEPTDYPNQVPGQCADSTQFDCDLTGSNCIAFSLVKDCIPDCTNGADEQCGSAQFLCDKNLPERPGCGICATKNVQCDDRKYSNFCITAPDPFNCTGTVNCVPPDWVGDTDNDCGDWSDENACVTGVQFPCGSDATCNFEILSATEALTTCSCNAGFTGDGVTCTAITSTSTSTSTTTASPTTTPSDIDPSQLQEKELSLERTREELKTVQKENEELIEKLGQCNQIHGTFGSN